MQKLIDDLVEIGIDHIESEFVYNIWMTTFVYCHSFIVTISETNVKYIGKSCLCQNLILWHSHLKGFRWHLLSL